MARELYARQRNLPLSPQISLRVLVELAERLCDKAPAKS